MNGKKMTSILLILLMAVLVVPMAFAPKPTKAGPAEKATGEYEYDYDLENQRTQYFREFNVHEAKDNRPAKGSYSWWKTTDGVINKVVTVEVTMVVVDGEYAWFAGKRTSDPVAGRVWSYIKVYDGGTPGSDGDKVWGIWFATYTELMVYFDGETVPSLEQEDEPEWDEYNVIDGNLVVHTYD